MLKFAAPFAAFALVAPALADPLPLTPADPQPDAAALAQGLAVSYAFESVRSLEEAQGYLDEAKPGPALQGLSYLDGSETDPALTSDSPDKVIAAISGFIRFDAPGTYALEIISNDGIEAHIGDQRVAFFDGVHGCDSAGVQEVEVPEAGWYALDATYFQRKGSSCLLMDWSAGGEMEPVPDDAFAYMK